MRACNKSSFYSNLVDAASPKVDLNSPPSGTSFEQLPDGFRITATTRSPMSLVLVPFTCVWAGTSMYFLYGRQIAEGHLNPFTSLFGLPFLLGSCWLIAMCAQLIAGKVVVTRSLDRLSVFTGVGALGWTRNLRWSDFRTVREDFVGNQFNWNRGGRAIVMEGSRRVIFGSFLNDDRRYFVVSAIQQMLKSTGRDPSPTFMAPRFR